MAMIAGLRGAISFSLSPAAIARYDDPADNAYCVVSEELAAA